MLLWVFLDSLRVFVCYFAFSPLWLSKFSLWPLLSLRPDRGCHYVSGGGGGGPPPPAAPGGAGHRGEADGWLRGYLKGGFPVTYWVAIREEGEA